MIVSPQSGSPSAWSWFSIRVEKVGVAPSGFAQSENVVWNATAFAEPLLSERPLTEPLLVEQLLPENLLGWSSWRTVCREQFLSNSRAQRTTSRITASHQQSRIPSLRTLSPSSLRARTCTSHKGFSTQIVRRKGSVARHRHSAAYRVWSTLNKSSAGRVHTQYQCNAGFT